MKDPFPAPAPPSGRPTPSWMESLSIRSRRMVPSPVPEETVTVRVAPEPDTPETEAPAIPPPVVSAKSVESTPLTDSLNVTVKVNDEAFAGFAAARVIDETVGGVVSLTRSPMRVMTEKEFQVPAMGASTSLTRRVQVPAGFSPQKALLVKLQLMLLSVSSVVAI